MKGEPGNCFKRNLILFTLIAIFCSSPYGTVSAQTADLPRLRENGDSVQLIVHGKPYVMLAGELHNSSATSLDYLATVWDDLTALNINTVLAAITWETIEPEEGRYDFSLIDGLVAQAREHDMKLVLLWFASWKNAATTYPPAWVKTDLDRFPRTQDADGNNLAHLRCLAENNWQADGRAFAAVMRHLRDIDSDERTVIMMQIENESGLLGDTRDRSEQADRAFLGQVPEELTKYLDEHRDSLQPEFDALWKAAGYRTEGSWPEVFGDAAGEVFQTWCNASYIGNVAEMGKAEYPLLMFANAWQDGGNYSHAGEYPSGGPIAKMIPVWQAAAPDIDILAPDIYLPDFKGICDKYVSMGNPLLVPEAAANVANLYYAVAEHDALCYSPFGIDGGRVGTDSPLAENYRLLANLMPVITRYHGTGRMIGLNGEPGETREIDLGDYHLVINFRGVSGGGMPAFGRGDGDNLQPGYGLIIALDDGGYLCVGKGYTVHFLSRSEDQPRTGILAAHEMVYENGEWVQRRWLNGDETAFPPNEVHAGLRLYRNLPEVQKVTIYRHE